MLSLTYISSHLRIPTPTDRTERSLHEGIPYMERLPIQSESKNTAAVSLNTALNEWRKNLYIPGLSTFKGR